MSSNFLYRRKVMHMSPPCIGTGGLKKLSYLIKVGVALCTKLFIRKLEENSNNNYDM